MNHRMIQIVRVRHTNKNTAFRNRMVSEHMFACQLSQQIPLFHMKDSWDSKQKMITVQICIQNYNMHFPQSNTELPNFGNYKISLEMLLHP